MKDAILAAGPNEKIYGFNQVPQSKYYTIHKYNFIYSGPQENMIGQTTRRFCRVFSHGPINYFCSKTKTSGISHMLAIASKSIRQNH